MGSSFSDDSSSNLEFSLRYSFPGPDSQKKRKINCLRDFPVRFCQLGREIKQNPEQEISDANTTDSVLKVADSDGLMKGDVKVVEEGVYDGLEEKESSPIRMRSHKSLLQRCRVSVVRDFPDGFLKLKETIVENESSKNDSAFDSDDDIEPFENEIEDPKRESDNLEFEHLDEESDVGFDLVSQSLICDSEASLLVSPDEEEVLQFAANSDEEGMLECDHKEFIGQIEGSEKPELEEDGDGFDANFVGQFENSGSECQKPNKMGEDGVDVKLEDEPNTSKIFSGILPKRRKFDAVRDFPDAFRRLNAGYEELNGSVACFDVDQNCSSVSPDDEEPFENDPLPQGELYHIGVDGLSYNEEFDRNESLFISDEEEPRAASYVDRLGIQENECTEVVGSFKNNAQGQGSGTKFCERHRLGSEEEKCRIIVRALMAAPRCPWRSQKRGGSKKRKCG